MIVHLVLFSFMLFSLLGFGSHDQGNLELPSLIGNNMILQQQTDVAIWGWDNPGTNVTVIFRNSKVSTKVELDGKWMARVPSGAAGGPFTLKIQGTNALTLENVLVGEVWVAGGQSNMWWRVSECKDAEKEISSANYPDIRVWDANTQPQSAGWRADKPQKTVKAAEWKITTPKTVRTFPGTAYFFARELHEKLKVPVGIVHLAVPGQDIETFLSKEFIQAHLPQALEVLQYRQKVPKAPGERDTSSRPGDFFNGMIYPTAPYTTRGFIWWQGENNAARSLQYRILFPSLIEEWRRLWGSNDAPFLFVELANFLSKQTRPSEDDAWPALRDAQREALRLPRTARISTIDILSEKDDISNIHPPNKQLAGHRLYLAAMANVYGDRDLIWSGSAYKSVQFEGNKATVTFDHIGSGLMVKDGSELKGFALAGSDRQFFWAKGEIEGNKVVLTSNEVNQPIAVRYAWANNPIGNLYNKEGLPAFPFRSDNWILMLKGQDFRIGTNN